LIVPAWVAAAAAAVLYLPNLREAQSGSFGDLVPNDADAVAAELRSYELFRLPLLSRTVVVQRDPDGLTAAEQADVVRRALALSRGDYPGLTGVAGAFPVTNVLGVPPFSRESSTTALTYLFFPPHIGQFGRTGLAERFVERRVAPNAEGFVGVTGVLPARVAQYEAIQDALPLIELATVALISLVVAVHFRAVGAPLANLATIAVAYLVAIRSMGAIGERLGVSIPSEIEPVLVALLLGIVTDYCIFFLARVRRRMGEGLSPRDAVERATADLAPIVLACGLAVVGAAGALVVAELGFFQVFGPGIALAVLVGLLVVLTFVPALLALAGSWLFWPSRPWRRVERAGDARGAARRRSRWSPLAWPARWPLPTALASVALLLVMASGLRDLDVGNPVIRGLPTDATARQAYLQAQRGFAPGILSPTVVLVEGPAIVAERRALARLGRLLEREPGVAAVVGPGEQPLPVALGAALSRTGNAARFAVVLGLDPLSAAAIDRFRALQARMPALLDAAGLAGARVSYAGDTALVAEIVAKTRDDLMRVAPVALLAVFAVLAAFLRSLVAPVYLLAASVLALAAALGLAARVFGEALGYGELTYYVPFAAAVLLIALGSDYNVFLAGRIWTEARRRPLREAVEVAGAQAAMPIAVAGVILAGSFALLALVPIRPFRELAFVMGTGLLIDAFLVRSLLMPALVALVGERSGWPGRALTRPAVRQGTSD
jgi:RND superfamily putative drug exporter